MILVVAKLKNYYTVKVNHEFEAIDLSDEVNKGEAVKNTIRSGVASTYKQLVKVAY